MFFKIIGIYVTCEENEKKPKEDKSESAFVHHVVKNRIGF